MEEEISLEKKYTSACVPLVDELIQKYCIALKPKICNANSPREAELIANHACREFKKQCISEIIPLLLKKHSENLIQKCW